MREAAQPFPRPEAPADHPEDGGFDDLWAPESYARLRGRLVRIFARRGCTCPEELADETISRVLARLPDVAQNYEGDPIRFVHGVARNVFFEHVREPRPAPLPEQLRYAPEKADAERAAAEEAHQCLDECLSRLDDSDRRLIQEYYRYERHSKADRHRELAEELRISVNTLRVRVHRIRQRVSGCVLDCAQKRVLPVK